MICVIRKITIIFSCFCLSIVNLYLYLFVHYRHKTRTRANCVCKNVTVNFCFQDKAGFKRQQSTFCSNLVIIANSNDNLKTKKA